VNVTCRMLAPKMQHMRCRQQKNLQRDNEPDKGRSKFGIRFGHQSSYTNGDSTSDQFMKCTRKSADFANPKIKDFCHFCRI